MLTRNPDKGELLIIADVPSKLRGFKISGDGSRVFCLCAGFIQAVSIQTGEVVGKVNINGHHLKSFTVDGSKVWVYGIGSGYQGWDFGILGSSPVQLPNMLAGKLHPNGIMLWDVDLCRVKDTRTGKVVFQMPKRYRWPIDVQWNDQYLVACFHPIEVLVLDFTHIL